MFEIEKYMAFMIENLISEVHERKWTKSKDDTINQFILNGLSLADISTIISSRTLTTIYTKANSLGFGYKRNEDNGHTYFSKEINHKNRRTKDEILEGTEKVPIESAKAVENCDKKSTVIIPEKQTIEISLDDIDLIKLTKERMDRYE